MKIRFKLLLLLLPCLLLTGSNTPKEKAYPIKYEEIVSNCSLKFDLDRWLIFAIIKTETNFGSNGYSHAGAQGLMQIMPLTATEGANRKVFPRSWLKDIYNPNINVYIGSWYLKDLIKKFKGNQVAAIVAYNAGPSCVKKWLENSVWDGTLKNANQIPYGESRAYLKKVTFYHQKYIGAYHHHLY